MIPGWEDPLEKETATYSSILAWRIPWIEEPDRLIVHGVEESDTTEQLSLFTVPDIRLHCIHAYICTVSIYQIYIYSYIPIVYISSIYIYSCKPIVCIVWKVRRTSLLIIHYTSCLTSRNAHAFEMNFQCNRRTPCLYFNVPSGRFLFHYCWHFSGWLLILFFLSLFFSKI